MFNVKDLIILSRIPGIGPNRLRILVSHFGNPTNVLSASARDIVSIEGFNKKLAVIVSSFRKNSKYAEAIKYADHQFSTMNKYEAHMVAFWDKKYFELLKKIFDPPPYLFLKGNIIEEDKYAIAVVGTRNPSKYGIAIAEKFSQELSRLGITIVSGLARGIDTIAHNSVLKTGGRTIAVIGSGIDVIYPPENKNLFEKISENGAVVSEYDMGTPPDAGNFPRRNRIISGMSLGTIIIETGIDGGAMITASTALDQNRDVFAVPGLINEKRSVGCNTLIRDGRAKLVTSIEDVLDELETKLRPILKGSSQQPPRHEPELTLFEKKVYENLSEVPIHIDQLSEKADMSTTDTLVNLLSLEFKGLVKQMSGKMFIRL
jgi:DNA processing protein